MSNPKPFLEPDDVYARIKELERIVKAIHTTPRTQVSATQVSAIATSEFRSNVAYGDCATVGPTAVVPVGTSGIVVVTVSCVFDISFVNGNAAYMSFEVRTAGGALVSGWGASDLHSAEYHISNDTSDPVPSPSKSFTTAVTGLTANTSYTFKAKYRMAPAVGCNYSNRVLVAQPI